MDITIGTLLQSIGFITPLAFIIGLFVGSAWMKRKAAKGFTSVDSASKAELKAQEKAIREKALATMNAELARARKAFKELL